VKTCLISPKLWKFRKKLKSRNFTKKNLKKKKNRCQVLGQNQSFIIGSCPEQ
jgi:hypothetical protein